MSLSERATPALVGVVTAALLAGAAEAAAAYVVRSITRPSPPDRALIWGFTPFETGVVWEDVRIPADDGAALPGWLMLRGDNAPTVLACGGYRGKRADLLGISSSLWRTGYNVLLFDYRGHGDAPGPVTLGYRELADARAALRFLRRRFPGAPLGAIGFSMGGAVAIMLAAREPEIRAVWADSSFATQRDVVRYHLAARLGRRPSRRAAPLAHVVLYFAERRLQRTFGFGFRDVDPLADVQRLGERPLYLVHGEQDRTVPPEHGRRLVTAALASGVPVEAWFVPDTPHCGAYFQDRPQYCARAAGFFGTHLGDVAT